MSPALHIGLHFSTKALILCLVVLNLAGCKKKNSSFDLTPNINVANDIVAAERCLTHTFNLLYLANTDSAIIHNGSGIIDNASITYISSQRKFIFRYTGKPCADSTVRNGTVLVVLTADFFNPGTHAAVKFQAYTEDARQFTGTDSIRNNGPASGDLLQFIYDCDSLIILKDTAHSCLWSSSLEYHVAALKNQAGGLSPLTITGTGNGVSSSTYPFSFHISTPLVNDLYCPWKRSGTLQVSMPSLEIQAGSIEYMNSDSCSNRVTYNFDGNVFQWWINNKKLSL